MSAPDQHAKDLVAAGALLLDVRSPAEFASGHIDGAKNVPLDQLPGKLSSLNTAKGVVVYCRSGARSARAASIMKSSGVKEEIYNLGGMARWDGGLDVSRYGLVVMACLTLGLAPFTPEPHLVEKVRWVASGGAGMAPMDVFDLFFHGAPWVLLLVMLGRDLLSSRSNS